MGEFNVLVVGAGNVAMCVALAASEKGANAAVLGHASVEQHGGNSRFTAGAFRVALGALRIGRASILLSSHELQSRLVNL